MRRRPGSGLKRVDAFFIFILFIYFWWLRAAPAITYAAASRRQSEYLCRRRGFCQVLSLMCKNSANREKKKKPTKKLPKNIYYIRQIAKEHAEKSSMPQRQHKLMVPGICAQTAEVVLVWSSTLSTAAIRWKAKCAFATKWIYYGGPTLLGDRKYSTYVAGRPRQADRRWKWLLARYRAAAESNHVKLQWIVGGISQLLCPQGREAGFPPFNCFFFFGCICSNGKCYYAIMQDAAILSLTDRRTSEVGSHKLGRYS